MSKNIVISEGQEGRTFTNVSRLFTPLSGGGTQSWIADDEYMDFCQFTSLIATAEGTYVPTSDGYISVTVNVPETNVIRGMQDGVEVEYSVDSTGYLIFEEVD